MATISSDPVATSTSFKTEVANKEKLAAQRIAEFDKSAEMQDVRTSKEVRIAKDVEVLLSGDQDRALENLTYEKIKADIQSRVE